MAASAAADLLVTTSIDSVCVWNVTNCHRVCTLVGHPYGAVMSHFVPEGDIIISMFRVRIPMAAALACALEHAQVHATCQCETACCCTSQNKLILTAQDGTIWLWETATRRVLHRPMLPMKGLSAPCTAADCSPNGMVLVTGTEAPVLFMWRIRRGPGPQASSALQHIIHLPESAGSAAQIRFTKDSQTVAGDNRTHCTGFHCGAPLICRTSRCMA